MKLLRRVRVGLCITTILASAVAQAGTWSKPKNQPGVALGTILQLRDGRILAHNPSTTDWYILTPNIKGNYGQGTWSGPYSMPPTYGPLYYGSQVLLTGKTVAIEGGEYNFGNSVWTTLGALGTITPWGGITWSSNLAPTGWTTLGDAESVILANGKYMQANCCTAQNAIYNGPSSWLTTGSVLQGSNDESGFTLLTNDKVLTVDAKSNSTCATTKGSELYNQSTGTWSCAANTPVQLYNAGDEELGAAVLMYNNKVLQFGGNVSATAIYDVASNTWSAGPTPAGGLDQADGPAALEPNGKVLAMLSPGLFNGGCQFVEYDPTAGTLSNTTNPAGCPSDSSYVGHLMILPSGQIMFTDFSGIYELYTPVAGVVTGVKPTITSVSSTLSIGSVNNVLSGTQLNGLSENNAYGDDYQSATNYPLIRLTSRTNGNVYWAFTHDDSTHSIAPGTKGTVLFDLPSTIPADKYNLLVVTNGIKSGAKVVTVQ